MSIEDTASTLSLGYFPFQVARHGHLSHMEYPTGPHANQKMSCSRANVGFAMYPRLSCATISTVFSSLPCVFFCVLDPRVPSVVLLRRVASNGYRSGV